MEDVVPLPGERSTGMVALVGPWGAGKSTALAHLAAVFSAQDDIVFLDHAHVDMRAVKAAAADNLVIFSSRVAIPNIVDECLRLALWGQDELIEYLLAVHPRQCNSVMDRLARADDRQAIPGLPELWRIVLDRMAEDGSVVTIHEALVREVDSCLANRKIRKLAEGYCRDSLCGDEVAQRSAYRELNREGERGTRLLRLLGHRIVQIDLATDSLAAQLKSNEPCLFLAWRLPLDLIESLAVRIAGDDGILERLRGFVDGTAQRYHSTTATLLHATGCGWRPKRKPEPLRRTASLNLSGASLPAASWPEVDLTSTALTAVDLTAAELTGAKLGGASANGACFRDAVLIDADLSELTASGADFTAAKLSRARARRARFDAADLTEANLSQAVLNETDFRGADLTRACCRNAVMRETDLHKARIDGADFSNASFFGANLSGLAFRKASFSGARFQQARLCRADLEFISLPNTTFEQADLTEAWLTGSVMPGTCFREACLAGTGLADIEWEGADLREADLQRASFHMGSSRSGLVDSPIAGEGSRTGFYTDDFNQQHFKPPEEIRKANLRGADLRGAKIETVDFYLVDLREARYTTGQLMHFRQCGAILEDRTRDAI